MPLRKQQRNKEQRVMDSLYRVVVSIYGVVDSLYRVVNFLCMVVDSLYRVLDSF